MRTILIAAVVSMIAFGCKETILQPISEDKIYHNDLLHGDVVGKVVQKESRAKVIVSQVTTVDSTAINPVDGSFVFRDLRAGNYNLTIVAENFRTYKQGLVIPGGTISYVGEILLSTTPDLVNSYYPEHNSEIVLDRRYGTIAISLYFAQPMDRVSVEQAFSTSPPSQGIFYWGSYTYAPYNLLYSDPNYGRAESGATITTFGKVQSVTYVLAKKDSYSDTAYTVTLSTAAHDTSGNHLQFPLQFRFSTVQSYYTIYGIQTSPVHGDVDVDPLTYNGILVTFPRRMNQTSTEAATTVSPAINKVFLWPAENVLRVYPGGPLLSDTTFTITIDGAALDKDGVPLGTPFTFSFRTASFQVTSTSPGNGEVFVSPLQPIYLSFNSYVIKSSVESAFSISPSVGGTFAYGGYSPYEVRSQIVFTPSQALSPNTKYTVTVSTGARDLYNVPVKSPYSFSFVVRPN